MIKDICIKLMWCPRSALVMLSKLVWCPSCNEPFPKQRFNFKWAWEQKRFHPSTVNYNLLAQIQNVQKFQLKKKLNSTQLNSRKSSLTVEKNFKEKLGMQNEKKIKIIITTNNKWGIISRRAVYFIPIILWPNSRSSHKVTSTIWYTLNDTSPI